MNYVQDNARMSSLRIADFFVVVGLDEEVIPFCHATRILGIDRLNVTEVSFAAKVLDRYPLVDRADAVFPEGAELFSFPSGVSIYDMPPAPKFHSFIHTSEEGTHSLGCCLQFFEPMSDAVICRMKTLFEDGQLPEKEKINWASYFVPKAIILISRWPFIEGFREVLCQFYRMSLTPTELPLERYICNFIDDVPAPPKEGQKDVNYYILDQIVSFKCPPLNQPNAWSSLPAQPLFECLDPENILKVFTAVLTERQTVFISSQLSLLTLAAETVTSLMYPLRWVHVYVPVLPLPLIGILAAPLPFIVGILTSHLEEDDCYISEETVRVYLDENRVEEGSIGSLPTIPEKRRKKILSTIQSSAGAFANRDDAWRQCRLPLYDSAYAMAMRPDEIDGVDHSGQVSEVELRCAFLNFFVAILMDYRKYMITDVRGEIFDYANFLSQCSESSREFMEHMLASQAFSQFIESRLLEDERNPDVAFFDESITAKRNRSTMRMSTVETPLLSDKETYMNSRTHIPTKPDVTNLPREGPFQPSTVFPQLRPHLFAALRPNTVSLGESMALRKMHTVLRRTPKKGDSPVRSPTLRRAVSHNSATKLSTLRSPLLDASPVPPSSGAGAAPSSAPRAGFRFGFDSDSGPQLETQKSPMASKGLDGNALKTPVGCCLSMYVCILAQLGRRQAMRSNKKVWGKLPLSTRHILMEYGGGKGTGTTSRQSVSGYSSLGSGSAESSGNSSRSSRGSKSSVGRSRSRSKDRGSSDSSVRRSQSGSKKLGLGGGMSVGGHNVHRLGSLEVNRLGSSEVYNISSSDVSRSGSMASIMMTPSDKSNTSDISEFSIGGTSNDVLHSGSMALEAGADPSAFGAPSGRGSPELGLSPAPSDDEGEEPSASRSSRQNKELGASERRGNARNGKARELFASPVSPMRENDNGGIRGDMSSSSRDMSTDSYDSVVLRAGRVVRSGSFDVLPVPVELSSMQDNPKLVAPTIRAFDSEGSTMEVALEILSLFSVAKEAPDDMPFRLLADTTAISFDMDKAVYLMAVMEDEGIMPDSKIASGVSIALSSSTSPFLNSLNALDVLRAAGWGKLHRHLKSRGVDGLEEFMLDLHERKTEEQERQRRANATAAVKSIADASADPLRTAMELETVLEEGQTDSDSKWSIFSNMERAFSTGSTPTKTSTRFNSFTPGMSVVGEESKTADGLSDSDEGNDDEGGAYSNDLGSMEWIDFQTFHPASVENASLPKWQRRYVRSISQNLQQRMQWSDEILTRAHPGLHVDLVHEFGTTCLNSLCGHTITPLELDRLWTPDPNNYTVCCPECQRSFVPRFAVVSSSPNWVGSDGPHTELWCEYLSPWSLRKEVLTVLKEYGIDVLLSDGFRRHSHQHTVVFWNLVIACRMRGLPYSFLVPDASDHTKGPSSQEIIAFGRKGKSRT